MDAISRYERRVYLSLAALSAIAAASWPAWGIGRADRAWGLALGVAAGVVRLWWTFFLARRLATTISTRSHYAALRLLGFIPLAAALAAAGFVDGINLYAAGGGVLFAGAASITGSVLELRSLAREDRDAGEIAEEAPR